MANCAGNGLAERDWHRYRDRLGGWNRDGDVDVQPDQVGASIPCVEAKSLRCAGCCCNYAHSAGWGMESCGGNRLRIGRSSLQFDRALVDSGAARQVHGESRHLASGCLDHGSRFLPQTAALHSARNCDLQDRKPCSGLLFGGGGTGILLPSRMGARQELTHP